MMIENVSINTVSAVDECEAALVLWFIIHKKENVLFYPIFLFNFLISFLHHELQTWQIEFIMMKKKQGLHFIFYSMNKTAIMKHS